MSFQTILCYAFIVFVIIIGLGVIGYISRYLSKKTEALIKNIEANDYDVSTSILTWVKDVIITDVVKSLNETVVKATKDAAKDGKITEREGRQILEIAIDTIKAQLSDKVQEKLSLVVGDLDSWIKSVIEVIVKAEKENIK